MNDGRVMRFGGSERYLFRGGQDPAMGPSDVRKWLLASIEDQYGNRLVFEYQKASYHFTGTSLYEPTARRFRTDPSGSVTRDNLDTEVVLRRIAYNFEGSTAHTEVTFHYNEDRLKALGDVDDCDADGHCVARPAVHVKYWHGGPLADLLMLDRIEMHTMGRLVRTYDLGQQTTAAGRVTLLDWLQECDYDYRGASCLEPLQFSYGDPSTSDVGEMGDVLVSQGEGKVDEEPWQYLRADTAVADFNGDGADDYVVLGDDGALWMAPAKERLAFRKVADASQFPTFLAFKKTEGVTETYDLPFGLQATDWNKDGLSDILVWGLDQQQFKDGENTVSRCEGDTGKICGRNKGAGRLSATVPLGAWVYQARMNAGQVEFSVRRVLAESDVDGTVGLATAAEIGDLAGVHLSGSIRHPGPNRHARIALLDYNDDGLTDFLYCTDHGNHSGEDLGVLAITTGAHLGERWVKSFDASVQASVASTSHYQFVPLVGAAYEFCKRATPVRTRPGRTEMWDPESRTVLTHLSTGPAIVEEATFGDLDFSDYDHAFADLNGDTLPDLLLHPKRDRDGAVEWWFNTGVGFHAGTGLGFVPGQRLGGTYCEMRHLASAVVGDFNSDGLDDLILPSCALEDRDRVDGLSVLYARRSRTGVVEFQSSLLNGIVPFLCEERDSWAPDSSPFRTFTGDFDGDGDLDLRVLGQEWDNGVPRGSVDSCARIPKQSKCCKRTYDQSGNVHSYDCWVNADKFNSSGECIPEDEVEYEAAAWKYFVQDISNTTFNSERSAWYLLSQVRSSPVAGKTASQTDIRYATGAGAELWKQNAGSCAENTEVESASLRVHGEIAPAPAPFDIGSRRVYQRTSVGSGCSVPGVAWCGARVTHAFVKAVKHRVSDNRGGWGSCSEQRLFYENARVDAWNGHVGFERVTRHYFEGGESRATRVDDFALEPVPMRVARFFGELLRSSFNSDWNSLGLTPVVLYPFASTPKESTDSEVLPSGAVRKVVSRHLLAMLDYDADANDVREPIVVYAESALPKVRAVGGPSARMLASKHWGNWEALPQSDAPPIEPLRVVEVVAEVETIEGAQRVTSSGAWKTVSAVGFATESVTWTAGASTFSQLRTAIPAFREITSIGGSRRLEGSEPASWFAAEHDAEVIAAEARTSYVVDGSPPQWPRRQAFVALPREIRSGAFARPDSTGLQDRRLGVETLTFDGRGVLVSKTSEAPGVDSVTETFTTNSVGFVEQIEQRGTGSCEPSCLKRWTFKPDALGLFAASVSNPNDHLTELEVDPAWGNVLRTVHPDGVVERVGYDALGRVESVETEGTQTKVTYTRESVAPLIVIANDGLGDVATGAMYREVATQTYLGRPNYAQQVVETWFDAAGRPVREGSTGITGGMVWSEREYDARGRTVRTTRPHVATSSATQGTVRFEYDRVDRLLRVLSPSPTGTGDSWVRYAYGSVGDAVDDVAQWLPPTVPRHRRVVVQSRSESSAAKIIQAFDAAARLTRSIQSAPSGETAVSSYEPGVDAPTRIKGPDGDVLSIRYDAHGRQASLTDPESGSHAWSYDAFGRVYAYQDNGTRFERVYDRLDRLTLERVVETDLLDEETTTEWFWDREPGEPQRTGDLGKLLAVSRSDGYSERYTYGGVLNQLDSASATIPKRDGRSIELRAGYGYDDQARLQRFAYPGPLGRAQVLHYNDWGHVDRVTAEGTGRAERTVWRLNGVYQQQFYQDVSIANGRLLEHRDYDPGSSLLVGLRTVLDGATVQDEQLGRDALGRVARRKAAGSAPERFKYDAFGRLEQKYRESGGATTVLESYGYSRGGKMERRNGATLSYSLSGQTAFPNAAKKITRGSDALKYDHIPEYGLTSRVAGTWQGAEVATDIGYDSQRRVRNVSNAESAVEFAYSASGQRVLRSELTAGLVTSTTAYFGKLYERVEDGSGGVRHVYRMTDPSGAVVVEEAVQEQTTPDGSIEPGAREERVLVRNYQGSVLAATLPGESYAPRSYDAFGLEEVESLASQLGYTGHRSLLPSTSELGVGFIDMGGRVYDPISAGFLQPDPTFPGMDRPQGFNRRAYVQNDPVNLIDPTGFSCSGERQDNAGCPTGGNVTVDGGALKRWSKGKHLEGKQRRELRRFNRRESDRRDRARKRFNSPYEPPNPSGATLGEASNEPAPSVPGVRDGGTVGPVSEEGWEEGSDNQVCPYGETLCRGIAAKERFDRVAGAAFFVAQAYVSGAAFKVAGAVVGWGGRLVSSGSWLGRTWASARTSAGSWWGGGAAKAAGGLCFAAGTPVHTEDGVKPIEEVEPGDVVWAEDEVTGEIALRRVLRTFVTPDQPIVEVVLEDDGGRVESIRATLEHPFWTQRGWVGAGELESSDRVLQLSGAWSRVASVGDTGERVTVYNFEVEGLHTYFVGQQGLLVHNSCLKSGDIVKIAEEVDDLVIFAAQRGESTIEIMAKVAKEGSTLFLRGAHIQGGSPGSLGVKGLFELARDLGRANGVSKVVIEGARRTTGVGNILGSVPRPITVNVP